MGGEDWAEEVGVDVFVGLFGWGVDEWLDGDVARGVDEDAGEGVRLDCGVGDRGEGGVDGGGGGDVAFIGRDVVFLWVAVGLFEDVCFAGRFEGSIEQGEVGALGTEELACF